MKLWTVRLRESKMTIVVPRYQGGYQKGLGAEVSPWECYFKWNASPAPAPVYLAFGAFGLGCLRFGR